MMITINGYVLDDLAKWLYCFCLLYGVFYTIKDVGYLVLSAGQQIVKKYRKQ
jgi:hypothetical protein